MIKNLSGIWEGGFSYEYDNEEADDVEYTPFRMVLQENEGKITGTCEDLYIEFDTSNVTGFIEDGMLSLIKKYQHLIFHDEETGDLYGDDAQPHPDIHYTGTFDEDEQAFVGTWEMVEEQRRIGYTDQYEEKLITGTWYMRLV